MSFDLAKDKDMILKAVGGSLMAYLFYGHIALQAKVGTLEAELVQAKSELDDIWGKYNGSQEMFMNHGMSEMEYKVKQAEKWEALYKEKYEELKNKR
ncbi:hypothetical protein KAR91_26725 [Candidatus Pacearchaeota archaeon]|nr:hypothetical protein [Candidatus Pacearchaeota archaeon]